MQGIGIRDSFFELGGHSLIAVRLFNEIADRHRVDLPMSALIQHPDIAGLAERIRGSLPEAAAATEGGDHASPMARSCTRCPSSPGPVGDGTPIFIVAGMFGNVLNLSHLANLLGEDRPSSRCRRVDCTARSSRTSPSRTWRATTSRRSAASSRRAPT